jgi:hypothetical protein
MATDSDVKEAKTGRHHHLPFPTLGRHSMLVVVNAIIRQRHQQRSSNNLRF